MNDTIKKTARDFFKSFAQTKELFVNDKGELFTRRDYAEQSTKNKELIEVITRADVEKTNVKPQTKIVKAETAQPEKTEVVESEKTPEPTQQIEEVETPKAEATPKKTTEK